MLDLIRTFPALGAFVTAWMVVAIGIVRNIRDEYSGRR